MTSRDEWTYYQQLAKYQSIFSDGFDAGYHWEPHRAGNPYAPCSEKYITWEAGFVSGVEASIIPEE